MGENGNGSSSDEEIPLIPVKNAISGLEKHLLIFLSNRKTTKNLKLIKYLGIVKLMEPKIQKSIYAYFEKKEC